jgi:hypothetical protein
MGTKRRSAQDQVVAMVEGNSTIKESEAARRSASTARIRMEYLTGLLILVLIFGSLCRSPEVRDHGYLRFLVVCIGIPFVGLALCALSSWFGR